MDSFLGSKDDILKTLNVDPKVGLTEDGRKKSLIWSQQFYKRKRRHFDSENIRIIERTYDTYAYICRYYSYRCKYCGVF